MYLNYFQRWINRNLVGRLLQADVRVIKLMADSALVCFLSSCVCLVLFQDIDFSGFKTLLDIFLEVETPEELSRHLFLSFVRIPSRNGGTVLKVGSASYI